MEPSNNNSSDSTAAKTQPQHSDSRPALSSRCSQQCQDWVSWALLNSTSRPRQLLNAMGGRAVREDKKPQRRKESASSSTTSSNIVLSHPHPDMPDTAAARRLIDELMHVYDVHVRQMDLSDGMQLAHSEVRAARETECRMSFLR
mmetsp:Transcript_7176/g.10428  ORF Transcript_7176/g.10428 Transcript_7176/m.10428 type:complete len:145 (-) Transcript_7176:26-460(-)